MAGERALGPPGPDSNPGSFPCCGPDGPSAVSATTAGQPVRPSPGFGTGPFERLGVVRLAALDPPPKYRADGKRAMGLPTALAGLPGGYFLRLC